MGNKHSHPSSFWMVLAAFASKQQYVWEDEAGGFEFKAILGYKVRFLSQTKQKRKGITELCCRALYSYNFFFSLALYRKMWLHLPQSLWNGLSDHFCQMGFKVVCFDHVLQISSRKASNTIRMQMVALLGEMTLRIREGQITSTSETSQMDMGERMKASLPVWRG